MIMKQLFIMMSLIVALSAPVQAGPIEVDLELVLLVDVSSSVDTVESRLQRKGYVEAMVAPSVFGGDQEGTLWSNCRDLY